MSRHLPLLVEIDRVFDFFNNRFCEGKLKKPMILLSPCRKMPQPMYGWMGVSGWKQGIEELREINLATEYLDRPALDIIETFLHEMAHLINDQANIVDIDLNTQYHFEPFKTAAMSLGLKVTKRKIRGYAYTRLGPIALQALDDMKFNESVFNVSYK